MKELLGMGFALLLSACASVQPAAPPQVRQESKHVFDKSYVLGQEKSVYVGEAMVRVKDYYELAIVKRNRCDFQANSLT